METAHAVEAAQRPINDSGGKFKTVEENVESVHTGILKEDKQNRLIRLRATGTIRADRNPTYISVPHIR